MSSENQPSDLATQLRVMEQAFQRADRLMTAHRFAGSIMHEVNNPLEALVNLIYVTKLTTTEENVREYMSLAEAQLDRLAQITRRSLSYYKNEEQARDADLIEIVESALSIHRHRLRDQKVDLHKRFRQPATARVFAGEILQVVSNLILNALDAVPEERAVLHVRVRCRTLRVHITIADNGSGIEPKVYANLFQGNRSSKSHGTGFGLWLCKSVIDKHGGSIRCCSSQKPSHRGTTFRVCVPIKGAAEAT